MELVSKFGANHRYSMAINRTTDQEFLHNYKSIDLNIYLKSRCNQSEANWYEYSQNSFIQWLLMLTGYEFCAKT